MMPFKHWMKNLAYYPLNFFSFFWPRKSCSILMYHSVGDHRALYAVKPENFIWQMAYLKNGNFNVISLARLIDLLAAQKEIPDKTVILTFDDGYEDNYLHVFPLLKKYNFPATIFLSTGLIGGERGSKSQDIVLKILNWPQIEEMHQSGLIDFQPHTISHPKLAKILPAAATKEIIESKKIIEERLNKQCRIFSYPYGNYDQSIIEILKGNGFIAAVTVKPGLIRVEDRNNLFELKRNFVYWWSRSAQYKGIAGISLKVI